MLFARCSNLDLDEWRVSRSAELENSSPLVALSPLRLRITLT